MNTATREKPGGGAAAMSQDGQPATCPECGPTGPTFARFEDLGPHLERHREDLAPAFGRKGQPLSIACPKGCGRHLPTKASGKIVPDWKHHPEVCDGQVPLQSSAISSPTAPGLDPWRDEIETPMKAKEARTMTATKAATKCKKCGKPYLRLGAKFDAHVKGCDGEPHKAVTPPAGRNHLARAAAVVAVISRKRPRHCARRLGCSGKKP